MDMEKIKELQEAIKASSPSTKVYVGSDSQRRRGGMVKYATVVILHIDGKHGGQLFSFIDLERSYAPVQKPKMRLLNEAYKAVAIAEQIVDVVGDRHFEVHLDLNTDPKHKSSTALSEATGYILGMLGIQPMVKPNSWAASCAADRLTK